MSPGEHSGHRERMRKRFLAVGLEGFAPHEALELLLFHAIPRQNVNPLAHRLLERFGSLAAVLEATPVQLSQVEGVGPGVASLISLVFAISRYAEGERMAERAVLGSLREAKAYCAHLFAGRTDEVLYVISLDGQGRVIHASPVTVGTVNEVPVYPRKVVGEALLQNAQAVVLAHNHPSGVAEPSRQDIETTDILRAALEAVDIRLHDHIICADGQCVSIRQWQSAAEMPSIRILPEGMPRAADSNRPQRRGKGTKSNADDEGKQG